MLGFLCYNFYMKKILFTLFGFLIVCGVCNASAFTEDYVDIAGSFVAEGKYSQALNYINKALMFENNNIQLREMKNDLTKILSGGNVGEVSIFERDFAFQQAEKFRLEKDFVKASMYYKKGIKENPEFASNYLGLAIVCYELKNFQEAKNNLNIYLAKEPRSDFGFMLRAKTNLSLGETPSALRDIKSADVLFSNSEYKLLEGIILTEMGKYSQARDILNKLSEELQLYSIYKYLGICEFRLGNYKSSVMNFERAIILFEDDKSILPLYNEAKRMSNEG